MDFEIKKIDDWRYLIPKKGAMRVPGLIFSSSELMPNIRDDQSLLEVLNVATLPGIV
ncbi:MAG: hypothetical protein ACETWD_03395 [Desulfatiglandales bacterium]